MFLFSRDFRSKNFHLFDFRKLHSLNFAILIPVFLLAVISFIMLYSAAGGSIFPWMIKQLAYYVIFLFIAILIACMEPDLLYRLSLYFYLFSISLLLWVLLFGYSSMGAQRWIDLKIIKVQPSEIMKISSFLLLGRVFYKAPLQKKLFEVWLFVPLLVSVVPFALIAMQPDLATALTCFIICGIVCFLCGVRIEIFLFFIFLIVISIPIIWQNLHEYQKLRVLDFLDPTRDPFGSGYSVIQSKIAIGSGGIFGKGILAGTQSQLDFLPENQTDFIFTMIAEEAGFIGSVFVIFCYLFLIGFGFIVSSKSISIFNKTIAAGASVTFFVHYFINSCMTMGIMPVAGIPMPLISYGGSITAVSLICVGLIMHADVNSRHQHYI